MVPVLEPGMAVVPKAAQALPCPVCLRGALGDRAPVVTGVGWGGLVAVPHREQPWGSLCSGLGAPALLASPEGARGGRGG